MNAVKFGSYHSFDDLQLILSQKTIGTPSPKVETVEIPGGDGVLDLTEFFDEIKYKNRTLSFEFSTQVPTDQFMEQFSKVQNALHGQKMNISLTEDPDWYYIGRISVSEWKADRNIGKLTIDCDCDPYKYRVSSQEVKLCGKNLLNLGDGVATTVGTWTRTETGYSFKRGTVTGGSFVYWKIPVKKGKQYTFSAKNTSTTRMLYVYKDVLYGVTVATAQSEKPCIFTATENGLYLFSIYAASSANAGDFTNIMVEEGGVATSFEAYDATTKEVAATLSNTRKSVIPTVYASGGMTVENGHNLATLSPGVNVLPDFVFTKGENTLIFKGNGVAVVEWKEGAL